MSRHEPDANATAAGNPRRSVRRSGANVEPSGLSDQDRVEIAAAVLALAPMSDEQIQAVCEVITVSRVRWSRDQAA